MPDRIEVSAEDLSAALEGRCVAIRDAAGVGVITGVLVGPRVVADALYRQLSANAAHREPPATKDRPRGGFRDFTCGACGEEHSTNFTEDEVECPECGARRCPHCETWFGGDDG